MAKLWHQDSLSAALNQKACPPFAPTQGVSIDTRTLDKGDIFIALKGENFDGLRFVDDALAKGAAVAIAEGAPTNKKEKTIFVPSSQQALTQLGAYARAQTKAQVIGITGSVGKTGVKDGLGEVLKAHRAARSFNNHIGVPLTLARTPPDAAFAVIEMGMNHKGEIAALTGQVRPHFVLITHIAPAHIGFFDSLEEIAAAKAEIFDGLVEGGQVLLNRDDDFFDFLRTRAEKKTKNIYSFGTHREADGRFISQRTGGAGTGGTSAGTLITADIFGTRVEFSQYIPVRALALNNIAVLTAAHLLGQDVAAAAATLSTLTPREGRGKRENIKNILWIDETYNANPASMAVALESLSNLAGSRAVAILGDMAELGTHAPTYHKNLLEKTTAADLIFLCGKEMKALHDILPQAQRGGWAATPQELLEKIKPQLQKGDKVLVKASLAMGLSQLLAQLKEQL